MERRLYFLIPDRKHALDVVDELVKHGIDTKYMHAVGDQRTRLDGLPNTSLRQRNRDRQRVKKTCWNINLACFALALVTLIVMPTLYGFSWVLLLPTAVIVATFMVGLYFTTATNIHLGEFRDALAHGEILLMVDVPESQAAEVETDIQQHHPEAAIGGNGWGTQAYGL